MLFETLAGTFKKQTDGSLRGTIDSSLSARVVRGEETDQDYEFDIKVNIKYGKVAVIINFTIDETNKEYYVEMVLDPENNKISLDSVIRNADGSENDRTELDSRTMSIFPQTDYAIHIVTKELPNDKYAVYGYIDNMLVVQDEDLGTEYTVGKHGLECLGSALQYSEFNEIFFKSKDLYTTCEILINELRSVSMNEIVGKNGTIQDYYDKLATYIEECSRFIDGECERDNNFFQSGGVELTEYHDGEGINPPLGMHEFAESSEAWEEGVGTIFTKQRPIISVTSVHENKAAIGETDDWQEITAFRSYKHGQIFFGSSAIPAKGKKNIRIIYKVGYAKMPSDIQLACTRLIVNLIHKQISDRTTSFQSFMRPTAVNFAMPDVYTSDIKRVFARYKFAGFGEM